MNGPRTPNVGPEDETMPEADDTAPPNDAELMLTLGSSDVAVTEFDELLGSVDDDDAASR